MATLFLISNPISHSTNSFTFPSLRIPPSRNSPPLLLTGCRRPRGATVLTRAGANASSYAFAIALPLSLLAVTVFTA
ncbi:putative high chlorophyll fluorescence 153, partial [Trifolium medium]|nr:putative high chlorophyll fluorescence 153 [Trifolium medium]